MNSCEWYWNGRNKWNYVIIEKNLYNWSNEGIVECVDEYMERDRAGGGKERKPPFWWCDNDKGTGGGGVSDINY